LTLESLDFSRGSTSKAITDADAKAEGVVLPDDPAKPCGDKYRELFVELWDEINAERGFSWQDNPFVRVIGLGQI
jgi:hypothetical protein